LQWALLNLAKDGTKIVIAHVHRPARMVPTALGPIHHKVLDPREVNYYRKKEREKAEEKLDQYLLICRELKVLFPSFNYLYHEPPVIRSFLCIS
jgi:hypothetical protein